MRRIIFITLFFALFVNDHVVFARERSPLLVAFKLDFVNQNVWRGSYQAGASVQPEVVVSLRDFEFSVWGTTDFEVAQKEIDLTVRYCWRNLSVGVTDYWCDSATAKYSVGHIPEINMEYGFAKIPLSLSFNLVVYGDEGRFSSYAEVSFIPSWREWKMEFAVGVTPWRSMLIDTDRFAITNLSARISKLIALSTTFSCEAFCDLIYNPASDNAFCVAGIGIPF